MFGILKHAGCAMAPEQHREWTGHICGLCGWIVAGLAAAEPHNSGYWEGVSPQRKCILVHDKPVFLGKGDIF